MGSGAIYAVIVALWAIVLVPMWLRRHDQVNESRSIDRFRSAMRTLSHQHREDTTVESREVLMPTRERGVDVTVTGPGTRERRTRRPASSSPSRAATARAAARRRRVLAALTALLAVTRIAAVAGVLPLWAVVVPVLLIVAFVVVARRQVTATTASRRRAPTTRTDTRARFDPDDTARPGGRVVETAPEPAGEVLVSARADGTWDAVDSPLPTYVTAPPASRIPRVIDLTTPGTWTGAAMVEQVRRNRSAAIDGASFADLYVDDDIAVDTSIPVAGGEFFDQMQDAVDDELPLRRAVNE